MIAKAEAGYGPGKPQAHCGICRHFIDPDRCELVDGEIDPEKWCKLFERRTGKRRSDDLSPGSEDLKPMNGAFRHYAPICKIDAEQRMVYGYASTAARDDQGEIVTKDALTAALPEYMRFANIREMHQNSAVGIAKQADIDDKGLYLGAKVIDNDAWEKVREGVYKGFSIGGRITHRATGDPRTITGLKLVEISLVDRPANPEATIDCWKAAAESDPEAADAGADAGRPDADPDETAMAEALRKAAETKAAREAGPVQKWVASDGAAFATKAEAKKHDDDLTAAEEARAAAAPALAAAEALAAAVAKAAEPEADEAAKGGDAPGNGKKPYGNVEYADPGFQADKKKRYPIDTEAHIRAAWSYIHKAKNKAKYSAEDFAKVRDKIAAAWRAKIDKDGPPEAQGGAKAAEPADLAKQVADDIRKHLADTGELAHMILCLRRLKQRLSIERELEGDDSDAPDKTQTLIEDMCGFLVALVAEETAEVIAGEEAPDCLPLPLMCLAAESDDLKKALGGDLAKFSVEPPAPPPPPPEIETLTGKVGALEKMLGEFGERMQAGAEALARVLAKNADLEAEVKRLADTPLPPKTVKLPPGITAVEKSAPEAPPRPQPTPEELATMPEAVRQWHTLEALRDMHRGAAAR